MAGLGTIGFVGVIVMVIGAGLFVSGINGTSSGAGNATSTAIGVVFILIGAVILKTSPRWQSKQSRKGPKMPA